MAGLACWLLLAALSERFAIVVSYNAHCNGTSKVRADRRAAQHAGEHAHRS